MWISAENRRSSKPIGPSAPGNVRGEGVNVAAAATAAKRAMGFIGSSTVGTSDSASFPRPFAPTSG